MKFSNTRYLSTFNTPADAGAPALPPPAAPPVQHTQTTVLQPLVVDMGQLHANRAQANQALSQVQAAAPPPPAAPSEDTSSVMAELRSLKKQVQEQNKLIMAAQLSEYRMRAIAAAKAQGHGLIEPLVGGGSFAEIDASVGSSIAEYAVMRADILLAQQQQAQVAAPASAIPAIPTPPVYAPTLPSAPVGYVGQAAPAAYPQQGAISAPQVISAPNVPQPQVGPGGMSAPDLAYYTSSEAIRNGSYAQNRAAIMQALRGGAPNGLVQGGQVVPLQGAPLHFAPPGGPIAQRQPAMQQQNVYNGVSVPRASSQGVLPTPPMGHGYPTAAGMQAQQPNQLQFADGSSNGVPVNPHAAREAALAAVQAMRG